MVNEAKGSLSRRRQGKYHRYFIYVPRDLWIQTDWPCFLKEGESVDVQISIDGKTLKIEEYQ